MSSLANANGHFNHLYGVAKRYDPSHVPFVFDKHIYRDFVRKFATLVEATISHKFRCVVNCVTNVISKYLKTSQDAKDVTSNPIKY